jgi:predicted transposase YdaD
MKNENSTGEKSPPGRGRGGLCPYRIFLLEPNLVAELIPGLPPDCCFDYFAPVLKERERRLDGLLVPLGDDPSLPLVFLEAQMQGDPGFYRRFFAQVFLYLEQYQVTRPWRGLLLFPRRTLNFGEEDPYQGVLATQVERFYLEDLIPLQELTPNLALLRLLVLSQEEAPENARRLLAQEATEQEFRRRLDLVCRGEKSFALPNLSLEAIREMLDITQVRVQDTQFYKDVFEKGQGQGESELLLRLLTRRCGELSEEQRQRVKDLSAPQREALAEALLEFKGMEDFQAWLQQSSV